MNKRTRIFALIAACCIITTYTGTAFADSLSDKKGEKQQIEQEIETKKSEIDELNNKKSDILQEISSIGSEMDELYSKVNQLNSQIDESTNKIKELEEKSIELQEESEKNRDVMNKRFRVLYQNNGTGYLDLLLNSEGFGDFLQRLDTINTLINFNNEVVTEYKNNAKELKETITAVNEEKSSLEEAKAAVDQSIGTLEEKRAEKKRLMAEAETNIEKAKAVLAQNEAEFDEILASITAMEEAQKPSRGDGATSSGGTSGGTSGGSSSEVNTNGMYRISKIKYPITSGFVDRINPVTGVAESHKGIDIGAPYGDPVFSLMGGTVTYAGWMDGYGNVVVVNHGSMSTLYAHNSQLVVSPGQVVSGGQQVAVVGSTGWSTGPHIHFEVIIGGTRIDPSGYYF